MHTGTRAVVLQSVVMRHARARTVVRALAIAIAVLVVLEIAVRAAGVVDFPLYEVDADVEYLPRPSQRGAFLNRNRWAFNERGMPTERHWNPDAMPNLLLIGNSIVAGGNPYDQREKLGPLVESSLADRYAVWPIAVGGWSTVNQIAYLERHEDVARAARFFVWSHTSGGLRAPSRWLGDDVFPRTRPVWASMYVLRRAVLRRLDAHSARLGMGEPYVPPAPGAVATAERTHLARFDRVIATLAAASGRRHPGLLLLYPSLGELAAARRGTPWLPEHADLQRVADAYGLLVVDLTRYPQWTTDLYRDEIHPTIAGNAVLARIIIAAMDRAAEE